MAVKRVCVHYENSKAQQKSEVKGYDTDTLDVHATAPTKQPGSSTHDSRADARPRTGSTYICGARACMVVVSRGGFPVAVAFVCGSSTGCMG
jgi:hypothetical protein